MRKLLRKNYAISLAMYRTMVECPAAVRAIRVKWTVRAGAHVLDHLTADGAGLAGFGDVAVTVRHIVCLLLSVVENQLVISSVVV